MTDASSLGGGYAESRPRPLPTVEAVLRAATPGSAAARLAVIAGAPGSGKSRLAEALQRVLPGSFVVDKDWCSGPFILEIARQTATPPEEAYGTDLYWERLRPLEYGTAVASACANLVGARTVFLVGGWGPELGVEHLWTSLRGHNRPFETGGNSPRSPRNRGVEGPHGGARVAHRQPLVRIVLPGRRRPPRVGGGRSPFWRRLLQRGGREGPFGACRAGRKVERFPPCTALSDTACCS